MVGGSRTSAQKIDGTNSRIVLMPDGDWFIGSREELLTARGDRVHNPALGIVDAIQAFYLETYGAKIDTQATAGRVIWSRSGPL